ncbi:alpha/beta hydrolase family esterase [Symbioplanes lichenis]|uniref:alpha/beta hydrolase family esterase n=1 Tax=Symbioplanes lichenis TaxID=1629072 RepID=UPI002738A8F5|nr:polyhydroxybutyrate depolymerase [Actinoplanes lichenis]
MLASLATVALSAALGLTVPATVDTAAACSRPADRGDTTVGVDFEGRTYPVLVHVPPALAATGRVPLVLNLHGSSGNGPGQMDYSGLRPVADANGFIVAAPDGAITLPQDPMPPAGSWAWNVPGVPTTAGQMPPPDARDDVAFLGRVIDVVSATLCTNPRRTYATGHSGGARMSSALACRLADRIAAIAAGAGLRAGRPDPDDVTVPEVEDCRPTRPVPVVTWHGQQDTVNPYAGSADLRWGYAAPIAAQTWARLDGCRQGPDATPVTEHVTRLTYSQCDRGAEVVFYRISNGGHVWPGATEPGSEIDAARIAWDFFRRH